MMKLTDLNIDCLENILEYLEFGDLLSAASSNERLNKAANYNLIRKSWHKCVLFSNIRLYRKRFIEFGKYEIGISDLKTILQYLRCFGHMISNIEIRLSKNEQSELEQNVINYINEYCSDSLIEITIKNGLKGWEHLNKPFFKVEEVELDECQIVESKNTINRLFPRMVNLRNKGNEKLFLVDPNHYSNLERLSISDDAIHSSKLCVETLSNILHLNPQLKYIRIDTRQPLLDSIEFQNALQSSKNLQTLSFFVEKLSTRSIDSVIRLKSVKTFNINTGSFNIMKIPFTFDKLEQFSIGFSGRLNAEFFSFIDKCQTIKRLELIGDSFSVIDLSTIAKSLRSLTSISFNRCKISANEAINFMCKFQNLSRFFFDPNETSDYDDIRAQLSNEWECEMNESGRINVIKK